MRDAFVTALVEEARLDERVVLLTADLGFGALEPFSERFPDRFYNVGVAEQNMIGIATGLAEAGYVPYAYSIASFASMRPYEFIRNGPVLHNLPVRIVGMGGGFDYGTNGLTHYALEDIAIMRAQPDLHVLAPADRNQVPAAFRALRSVPGPAYLRLERGGQPVPGLDREKPIDDCQVVRRGTDILLVAMGGITHEALRAADLLAEAGISAGVVVVATVSPPPRAGLRSILSAAPLVVTVESHYVAGGLGSLVCELVAESGLVASVLRCAVARHPRGETGSQSALHRAHGLDGKEIARRATEALARGGSRPIEGGA